ncbi:MAG TPA: DUF4062 domain-containing protein [Thermoanaerobaculia bacterium]
MAVRKLQVFLASRFGDFPDERLALVTRLNAVKEIAVEAIDLNDNLPNERPPIERCYEAIDQAEVFVLLIGMTYGEGVYRPDGESYTHLEYRRALDDRSKIILPYVSGSIAEITRRTDCHPRLREWLRDISKKQCAARLDPALSAERNASIIFEVVLSRLWEIYIGAVPDEDGDDDDAPSSSEDSPIKRKELNNYAKMAVDRKTPPLRHMAANHVKEALDALQLKLPQIAIQHLRAAVDLVPLDVVLSYWLARLLIATGRRAECVQGRTIALRCARIAARQENKMRQMVAMILAARANERLEERELALEAAQEAHDLIPQHSFAKLEVGRQHALSGQGSTAFKFAEQAFWLRAESIHQIERDDAYRSLGGDFDKFRDDLGAKVRSETEAVFDVELAVVDYARELHSDGAGFTPGDAFADLPDRESLSSLKRVRRAHDAARHTLDLLRRCSKQIVAEADAFKSHGFRRLRQETLDAIEQAREVERGKIADAAIRTARARKRLQVVATLGGALMTLALIAAALVQRDPDWKIGLLLSAAVVVIAVTSVAVWTVWPRSSASRDDSRAHTSKVLDAYDEAATAFHDAVDALRERIIRFSALVHRFEKAAAHRVEISPAGTIFRDKHKHAGDIFRLDGKAEGIRFEPDLLSVDLQFITGDGFAPKTTYWFACYMGRGDPEVYSRSSAYIA